jgi:hypothetical protein
MRVRAKLQPGQPGTKALLKIYGDQLICVCYRYDHVRRRSSVASVLHAQTAGGRLGLSEAAKPVRESEILVYPSL